MFCSHISPLHFIVPAATAAQWMHVLIGPSMTHKSFLAASVFFASSWPQWCECQGEERWGLSLHSVPGSAHSERGNRGRTTPPLINPSRHGWLCHCLLGWDDFTCGLCFLKIALSLILKHSLTFSLIPSWKEIELSTQIRRKLWVICCIEAVREVRSFICSIELFRAAWNECKIHSIQIFENDNSSKGMWYTVILIWRLVIHRPTQYMSVLRESFRYAVNIDWMFLPFRCSSRNSPRWDSGMPTSQPLLPLDLARNASLTLLGPQQVQR